MATDGPGHDLVKEGLADLRAGLETEAALQPERAKSPKSVTDLNARVPRHLGRIIRKALEKNVTRRYQTALDLRNDLDELNHEIDSGEIVISGDSAGDQEGMRLPAKRSRNGARALLGAVDPPELGVAPP